jgi:hypothetical protein
MKTSIRTFVLASNAAATLFQRIEQEDIKTMRDVFSEGHAQQDERQTVQRANWLCGSFSHRQGTTAPFPRIDEGIWN